jgi:hypothetical protein
MAEVADYRAARSGAAWFQALRSNGSGGFVVRPENVHTIDIVVKNCCFSRHGLQGFV